MFIALLEIDANEYRRGSIEIDLSWVIEAEGIFIGDREVGLQLYADGELLVEKIISATGSS